MHPSRHPSTESRVAVLRDAGRQAGGRTPLGSDGRFDLAELAGTHVADQPGDTYARVPRSQLEIVADRITSSVTRPPAFRRTLASPSSRPSIWAGSIRASIQ